MTDIIVSTLSAALLMLLAVFITTKDRLLMLVGFVFALTVFYMAGRLSFIGWAGLTP